MKDFEKVDWKTFNKPTYLQQWLCKEDTLKLATFGDKGLGEADGHILSLINQWDLEEVGGHLLDRIGKLLNEKRNGSSDDYYRILINLRRLLNTNHGSIPDIIKTIKYFYSSEVVHIVPDYPAGLIIEHDGEGTPGLNFNKLLTEIIPAGVSFSTKELFNFIEELFATEEQLIQVHRDVTENFEGRILHNGRILHDGQTVLPTEYVMLFHNGAYSHDGEIQHNRKQRVEAISHLLPPFKHSSGYREIFLINYRMDMQDKYISRLLHNRSFTHNGEETHSGKGNRIAYDCAEYKINNNFSEAVSITETQELNFQFDQIDVLTHGYRHNGKLKHDKTAYHYNLFNEKSIINILVEEMADGVTIDEDFVIGMRVHHFHNGDYSRNSGIKHNAGVLINIA